MKPFSPAPHDPLDELLAAALHGELSPQERADLEFRLENNPAARAAYQEISVMHDLLEKNYREAQPDPAFEERMISGVRRKLRNEAQHRETAWQSVLVLGRGLKGFFAGRRVMGYALAGLVVLVVMGMSLNSVTSEIKRANGPAMQDFAKAKEEADSSAMAANAAPMAEPAPAPPAAPALAPLNAPALAETPVQQLDQLQAAKSLRYAQNTFDTNANSVAAAGAASAPTNSPQSVTPAPAEPVRKLVRNAQLDLEVASFQKTVDALGALVNANGGYVDSSSSQRGGNGKLQGTVVVKVLPEKLDAFLLQLRDLGEIKNQSVATEDVTRAYYDTQARLDNARRMETQLQQLLQRDNGKVSELLQVERELGRVRGEIEQMQGELKLYDFQVQYATVTINVSEKDLHQAAAYLLRERDDFSLFAPDVEAAFRQARQAADSFKADVLNANLQHNSDSDISATLTVSVPPEQIDGFLGKVRTLGRIENFTRQTERVANDGGDTNAPADETRTEKDRVQVNLTIRSDDETPREQTQLSVVAAGVEDGTQQAKQVASAAGAAVTASSFSRETDGTETADLTFRLPMAKASGLLDALKKLGSVESLSVHRDDRPGETNPDSQAPAEISLHLHNESAIVADDSGVWPTLRRTLGEGIAAFLGSVQTIGVLLAFALPWLVTLAVLAWVARRIYVWRRKAAVSPR